MLNPKLSAIRSIPSKSSFRGNKVAINAYPGRKSTNGKPGRILTSEISFNGATNENKGYAQQRQKDHECEVRWKVFECI